MENLPASQQGGFKLGPKAQEERLAHREWIGGRVYTLLSHYWREDDEDMLTAAIAADWADVLEGIPQEYIRKACIRYARNEPRRKPTPGAIYQMARAAMPAPKVVHRSAAPLDPEREPCAPDVAQRICEEAGYVPKRFGGGE